MLLTPEFATRFAEEWIDAWNLKDIDKIMKPYSDDIEFHSPNIGKVMNTGANYLLNKKELRAYWTRALDLVPELNFVFQSVLVSSDGLTILYENDRQQNVAETFIFNKDGLVRLCIAAKTSTKQVS